MKNSDIFVVLPSLPQGVCAANCPDLCARKMIRKAASEMSVEMRKLVNAPKYSHR
jgi:hypothetical protein